MQANICQITKGLQVMAIVFKQTSLQIREIKPHLHINMVQMVTKLKIRIMEWIDRHPWANRAFKWASIEIMAIKHQLICLEEDSAIDALDYTHSLSWPQ
jgi:hypothetical protein